MNSSNERNAGVRSMGAATTIAKSMAGLLATLLLMTGLAVAQPATPMLAAGGQHSLALLSNGTVKAWGWNSSGQLGLGNTTNQTTPQMIPGLSGVTALAAGSGHSLALLLNGTVKAWGYNSFGQLGLGNTTQYNIPQLIPGLSGVAALAAGAYHSLALLTNGTVKAWGYNESGQLGLGYTTSWPNGVTTPQLIPGLTGVAALATGQRHTLALLTNGTVMAWGNNGQSQLGLGNTTNQTTPQLIPGLSGVSALAAGYLHTLALLTNGTVMAWGNNLGGQLGLGNAVSYYAPPQLIPGLSGVSALAAGEYHSLALLTDGTVKAWGYNESGQLGLGYTTSWPNGVTTPQLIPGLTGVAGVEAGYSHTLVLLPNGTVKAWGWNSSGQLGLGNTTNQTTPQLTPGLNLSLGLVAAVAVTSPLGASRAWSLQSFGVALVGTLYLFDISLTGSSPGVVLTGAGTLPLNPPVLNLDYGASLGSYLANFIGFLDANGNAVPTVAVPYVPALMGVVLTGAAITLDSTSASQIGFISNAAATQLVAPVAVLSSVLPGTAPHFGGTPVTIVGSGFMPGAAVSMGGVAATNVAVVDQTAITCTAPANAPGSGSVSVTNPGVAAGTWSGQFVWLAPTITAVAPATGATEGGAVVGISGATFHPTATVSFGGTAATAVSVVNEGYITCTAPAHAVGSVAVVVTNAGGVQATATGAFTYVYVYPAPQLTGVQPSMGPIAGGTPLTISGSDFQAGATVSIGGNAASSVTVLNPGLVTCIAPAGTLGPANIVLVNPDFQQVTLASAYTYLPNLSISGVTPLVAAPGATITVNGTGFNAGMTLDVGGQAITAAVVSSAQLTFAMPSGLACSISVVLGNASSQTATFTGFNPAPSITSIPIASGPAAGGGSVIVLGANFHPGTTVTIGGQAVTILSMTLTSIFGTAPAGSPGATQLVVTSASSCSTMGTYTWN